ncbi:MAG: hypothetical protein KAH54_10935 [Candidatus Sabulitectum sp.]|nr:hypothetical protein [Candidatus Sabulitectum sp.]
MASKRSRKKQPPAKWRTVLFFFFLTAALAVVVSLVAPPGEFMESLRDFLSSSLGLLVVFLPVSLFLMGSLILRLDFADKWLRRIGAVFVCTFFFAAMISLVLCRIKPELLYFAGGELTGRVVLAVQGFAGGVISWVGLFSLFMISLVVFTGWDVSGDINSILGRRRSRKRASGPKKTVPAGEPDNTSSFSEVDPPEEEMSGNPWVQKTSVDEPGKNEPSMNGNRRTKLPVDLNSGSSTGKKKAGKKKIKKAEPSSDLETGDQYELPGPDFLSLPADGERRGQTPKEIHDREKLLVKTLSDFGVECTIADSRPGPVLTRYELTPGVGVKVNRILNLSDDLALALAAKRIRILAPIPGRGAVGIEVPNRIPETVYLREIISKFSNEKIPVALGKKLEGEPYIVDLTDMPHLLIAGATGSGKSVCVHAIISTILLTRSPYQVKLALVDPKMLELSAYKGIPHLWAPVVIETSKARYLLEALVKEMEDRYSLLVRAGVRSIGDYNKRIGPDQTEENLPYIVVVIDELADLMMASGRDVEQPIARLAGKARAAGIHLVVATQRPSVDVITGVIKANFPSRIAFNVGSKVDSRTIIDFNGAEKLLGKGDMLFVPAASPEPVRVHGSFISTTETRELVDFWREQPELPFEYEPPDDEHGNLYDPGVLDLDDPLLEEVKRVVIAQQVASISMVQRKFRVGHSRAGKLIDMLEQLGVVGPYIGSKPRDVLVKPVQEEATDESEN